MYRSTKFPDLIVDIRSIELSDGRSRVRAVAMNPENDIAYSDIPPYTTRPVPKKRRANAETEAIAELEKTFYSMYGAGVADEKAIYAAFSSLKADVGSGFQLRPTWNAQSTNDQAITYFERNVLGLALPYLVSNAPMFLAADREQIEASLIQDAARHCGGDMVKAREAVGRHLLQADTILAHMRDKDPRIPEIRLSSDAPIVRAVRNEQVKMLDIKVLLKFYALLFSLAEQFPKMVFFSVLVIFGFRPAEAAGTKPCDIVWHKHYCVIHLERQEENGKITGRLKNRYSYRTVIIPYWGRTLLSLCCEQIGENYPKDTVAMTLSAECSVWVKELLLSCGASTEEIRAFSEDIPDSDLDADCANVKDPEQSAQNKEKKITCYVLRRCFATIMRNIMGFTLYETDRMLGHIPIGSDAKKARIRLSADMNSPDVQASIAAKMERYVFDLRFTLNPAYAPITTQGQTRINLIPFTEYVLENNGDRERVISLNLEASEAGEDILVEMVPDVDQELSAISTPKSWENAARTVIGQTNQFHFQEVDHERQE